MKRPLVIITLFYAIAIVLLNYFGVTDKIPANDIARYAIGKTDCITGKIISAPEESRNRTTFILKCDKINESPAKGRILVNVYTDENVVSYGDIIEITGKFFRPSYASVPGTFDYKKYLLRKKIYAILSVYKPEEIRVLGSKPAYIMKMSLSLRKQILKSYNDNLLPQQAAILSGITIGERSGLTDYIQKIFVDAGIMHALVVSGSNVAFVALIFFWVFRKLFRLRKNISWSLLIPIIILYTLITGSNPPVVRATIMTLIVIMSVLLSRNSDVYQGLFFAAFVILLFNPHTLFEAGFQMSFIATLGIIYFFPKFQSAGYVKKLPAAGQWIIGVFFASLAAQIAIFPLMAYYFNKVSIIAIISNLFILPLVGLLLGAGFTLYAASLIGGPVLLITAKITGLLVSLVTVLVDFFANIPHSTLRTPTPSIYFIAVFYIVSFGIPKMRNFLWRTGVFLAGGALLAVFGYNQLFKSTGSFKMTFLDVKLGDAIYCEFPDGSNMLIDGGGNWNSKYDIGEATISPFLWNKGVIKIDTVILTHTHFNHYQGLIAVIKNFKIGHFITAGETSDEAEYIELMKAIANKNIPLRIITAGENIGTGSVKTEVLWPEKIRERESADDNSVALKFSYGTFSALLCSDIPKMAQNKLTENDISADILMIPGHGKKKLLLDFLNQVEPEYAIISTDRTSDAVADELSWYKTMNTAEDGTISVESDGSNYKIRKTRQTAPMEMIIQEFN